MTTSNFQKPTTDDDHNGITFEVIETQGRDGKKVSRGVYLVPNLITTLSMLSAFLPSLPAVKGDIIRQQWRYLCQRS